MLSQAVSLISHTAEDSMRDDMVSIQTVSSPKLLVIITINVALNEYSVRALKNSSWRAISGAVHEHRSHEPN